MISLRWTLRLLRDVLLFGVVNRSCAMSLIILLFLFLGVIIVGAEVSAPFIYTLF